MNTTTINQLTTTVIDTIDKSMLNYRDTIAYNTCIAYNYNQHDTWSSNMVIEVSTSEALEGIDTVLNKYQVLLLNSAILLKYKNDSNVCYPYEAKHPLDFILSQIRHTIPTFDLSLTQEQSSLLYGLILANCEEYDNIDKLDIDNN
jgi:hypothetical protein